MAAAVWLGAWLLGWAGLTYVLYCTYCTSSANSHAKPMPAHVARPRRRPRYHAPSIPAYTIAPLPFAPWRGSWRVPILHNGLP